MDVSLFYTSSRNRIRIKDATGIVTTPIEPAREIPNTVISDDEQDDEPDDEIGQFQVGIL